MRVQETQKLWTGEMSGATTGTSAPLHLAQVKLFENDPVLSPTMGPADFMEPNLGTVTPAQLNWGALFVDPGTGNVVSKAAPVVIGADGTAPAGATAKGFFVTNPAGDVMFAAYFDEPWLFPSGVVISYSLAIEKVFGPMSE